MFGIATVMTLIAFDQTVVGTALPRVIAELQGFAYYAWVGAAYLLTNAIFIPITGRLGDLYGRKPFVIASILVFSLASALCGLATTMGMLVAARAVQGIGGGMLIGAAFASVSDLFPEPMVRARWQAILSVTFGIASGVGPVLGGWMTEHLGWRSVFYVNLPIGVLALALVWRFLPHITHHEDDDRSLDWAGALLMSAAIAALLLATETGKGGGFRHPVFWGLVVLAGAFGSVFARHQTHTAAPIVPPHLFDIMAVRRLCALAALIGFVLFVMVYYLPLMLQGGFDLSPKAAGTLFSPLVVSITLGSVVNGRLLPRLRAPEKMIARGLLIVSAGICGLLLIDAQTPHLVLAVLFAVCGFGFGFQLANLTLQVQAAVPRRDMGAASAVIQTTRTIGNMFGASLAGLVVDLQFHAAAGAALTRARVDAQGVAALFTSPQLLVRGEDQASLAHFAQALGFSAPQLLDEARIGLIDGVRVALAVCLACALAGYVVARGLPPFASRREGAPAPGAGTVE